MSQTTYLITGAEGKLETAMVSLLAQQPNTTTFAATNTFSSDKTWQLLNTGNPDKATEVQPRIIDTAKAASTAVTFIAQKHNVDIVIVGTNSAVDPRVLFSAITKLPMVKAAPKFVVLREGKESWVGDFVRQLHKGSENLVAFAVDVAKIKGVSEQRARVVLEKVHEASRKKYSGTFV